jgi:hypothetical protein
VSEFVDECRSEWKRLGVEDHLADEMAAELSADLDEAESEGASAADLLGSSASDPQAFAASWALERGLIHPRATRRAFRSRQLALAVLVTVGFLVVISGAAAILASETGQRGAAPFTISRTHGGDIWVVDAASQQQITVTPKLTRFTPISVGPPPTQPGDDIDPIAWALLAVGVIGIISASLLWTASRRNRPPAPA